MSKRNSQEAKRAARERLRVEREQQAKKERMRRQLGVAGAVVAVLAIAAGIGVAITNMTGGDGEDNSDWSAASQVAEGKEKAAGGYKSYLAPANTEGEDGTDIIVGEAGSENTVTIYEDMRCPVCSSFEESVGGEVLKDIEDGSYKVEFVFGTFLDKGLGGSGSKNALSALGAALNESPEAFLEYKKLLYSKEHHPEESGPDKFGDDAHLIELAQKVDALKDNAEFEKNVTNGTYDPWALKVSKKFDNAEDVQGTPTVKLNGEKVATPRGTAPMTPPEYKSLVQDKLEK
ncbi:MULTISPECIES: thioredoxin domain-containing protein [unclassified Streptomyces]|uniref:thioredoxin domain-containing protein n=1 Tax=unclassified Streptomyces TaxID=2593676 RepID=UPI0022B612C6|nr:MULTISPECIES: thioredoxin domain-containing protein [unclassified Streptomyces]MCZ7413758.1 thioredoxin domain-containing protein [Streptomyces sp. WMMC897]MCZ7430754.1 thioredoxin domain-containing protein [Streptomyces sp. WMMC1477]